MNDKLPEYFYQWHIYLQRQKLSRPTIQNKDLFQKCRNDALVQVLVDDFGRCLEELYKVMTRIGSKGKFDFAQVLKEVVKALHEAYPDVRNRIDSMREAFLAVVGHRVVRSTTTFGKSSLDQVLSAGLLRLPVRGCILQCPYVLYLMLATDEYPWQKYDKYLPGERREDISPWQDWQKLNYKFRLLKSLSYTSESPVSWKYLHRGARFWSGCDREAKEVPRGLMLSSQQMNTKSQGFSRDKCSCGLSSTDPIFLYQPATGSLFGDLFLCLEDATNGIFHEVHHYEQLDDGKPLSLKSLQGRKGKGCW